MSDRFLILGAGYSGKAFGRANAGSAVVLGTTRSEAKFDALREAGVKPLLFYGSDSEPTLAALSEATHLIVSIAPGEAGDPGLDLVRQAPKDVLSRLKWIGYLSTVGVYGNHDGGWVDETSECRPVSRRSILRVAAERAWQDLGAGLGVPVAVLRLSGIYGPGRNAFVNLANGTARRLVKADQVFNRIHVEDIAAALWLLAGRAAHGVYNVTDDEPAAPQDVVAFAAALMGVPPPPEQPFETAQLSPMARSFYGENKRVSNRRVRDAGLTFRYPDYRVAHRVMWEAGSWRGEAGDGRSSIGRADSAEG